MSDIKKKEEARQTRTERELEALGEGTGSRQPRKPAAAAKPKPKPKPTKPHERRGTGRNDAQANFDRLSKGLRERIYAAEEAGNSALAQKLKLRLEELRKVTEQSK